MTRKEYTDAVLAVLRHVTRREREAIRREIDGHIEDHMEDLLELDYPPELAEERTLSAMGDPGEVGRALNRQYPFRWLVAARTAMVLTIAAVLLMGSGLLGFLSNTGDNLRARFCPETLVAVEYHSDHLDAVEELDLRAELEDVTVRVYQAGLIFLVDEHNLHFLRITQIVQFIRTSTCHFRFCQTALIEFELSISISCLKYSIVVVRATSYCKP